MLIYCNVMNISEHFKVLQQVNQHFRVMSMILLRTFKYFMQNIISVAYIMKL